MLEEIRYGNDPLYIFMLFIYGSILIVALIATIIYYSRRFGIKSFHQMRMNHGAEHKAIIAYLSGKIEDIDKTSRFVKMCGGNIVLPILAIVILGGFIHYPFTLSMIYYLCYLYIRPIRSLLFNIVGIPVQFITTEEPSPEILGAAKIGLLKLILIESVHNYVSDKKEIKRE